MGGVELGEMRIHLRRTKIVDRNDLHFPLRSDRSYKARNMLPDPSVSVDCYVDHFVCSPVSQVCGSGCGQRLLKNDFWLLILLLYYRKRHENAMKRTLFMFY